ncbi:MAG: acyl-CoA dehydrogenase family protein [Planctomycetota bacterium]|jgi:alkylation response protein AidB-like acyl-CoA dehydrogenase
MGNFYKDNDDIQFLFRHMDLEKVAGLQEEGFKYSGQFETAPANAEEAVTNYDMVLDSIGQLSADFIAPRSEDIDHEGNTLNPDGTVSYAKGIADALDALAKADVMGFTLPHRFGGLNFPNTIYSMAIEIVSRADASLMNIFGLQGIAETINFFADEDIKQHYLHDFASGKVTGAMVLTEPDAGSDLQACKLRAFQDERLRRSVARPGTLRGTYRRSGPELICLRPRPDRQGSPSRRQTRYSRFADLRVVL